MLRNNTSLPDIQGVPWIPFGEFTVVEGSLGEGTFGLVYQYRWKSADTAIKWFTSNARILTSDAAVFEEARLTQKAAHPQIVRLMGLTLDAHHQKGLVLEWMCNDTLTNYLTNTRGDNSEWLLKLLEQMARDLVKALKHLHSLRILHRDIKNDNILLNARWEAKLADLGCSVELAPDTDVYLDKEQVGYRSWYPPEIDLGEGADYPYSYASDTYCFGRVLDSLVREEHTLEDDASTKRPLFFTLLLQRCLSEQPRERPTIQEVDEELNKHNYKFLS